MYVCDYPLLAARHFEKVGTMCVTVRVLITISNLALLMSIHLTMDFSRINLVKTLAIMERFSGVPLTLSRFTCWCLMVLKYI